MKKPFSKKAVRREIRGVRRGGGGPVVSRRWFPGVCSFLWPSLKGRS